MHGHTELEHLHTQRLHFSGHSLWVAVSKYFSIRMQNESLIYLFFAILVMWWWILWHLWHDFDHIVGEFPYPKPREWTNAELGIPPIDEE